MNGFKTVAEDRGFIRAEITNTETVSFCIKKDDEKGWINASLHIGGYGMYLSSYAGHHSDILEDVEVLFSFVKAFRKALKAACND